jgi:hypothetical protein
MQRVGWSGRAGQSRFRGRFGFSLLW